MPQFNINKFSGAVQIDDVDFTLGLINIQRKVDVLDKYAERTIDGDLKREILGVYFNYKLTFSQFWDMDQYNKLFKKLTEPKDFHRITIVSNTGLQTTFQGYVAGVEDVIEYASGSLRTITGLKCDIIAKQPTLKP